LNTPSDWAGNLKYCLGVAVRIEHFISVNLIDTREIKAFERLGVTFEITGPLASFEIGESDPLWPSVAALLREFACGRE
jgi:hypothetical protein